jgi:hypothetical protein
MSNSLNNERITNDFNKKHQALAFSILLAFGAIHLIVVLSNHYLFRTYAFDYSVYNFAFFDYAHGRISPCSIYLFPYNITFLQDHFSLTLMLFAPLYWLLTPLFGTYTLLCIQWVIVMAGAWATYRLIDYKDNYHLLSLLAMVYYLILFGRFNASAADCNLAIMGSAVVPVFLYFFEKEKIWQTFSCFLFLLINREDYAFWLIFICGFLMLVHRRNKPKLKLAFILFTLSIISFIIIFKFIIPALEDENKKYTLFNFAALGSSPLEALQFIIRHPLKAIELLFTNHNGNNYYDGIKLEFYLVYLISGGCLLFLKPAYLIPFLPLLVKKMYNDEPIRWGIESYYSVEVVSILPIMVFLILNDFKNEKLKVILATIICTCAISVTSYEITKPSKEHIALFGNVKKINFLSNAFYKSDVNVEEINNALRMIPEDAAVCASGGLSSHLAFREKIYTYPKIDDASYICLIKYGDNWPSTQESFSEQLKNLIESGEWRILVDGDNFIMLNRK